MPLDWLYSCQLFGIKLGLEGVERLLAAWGLLPLPAGIQLIHVAGTNGKGSTCAMVESMARHAGYKTGLFTSPHLICFEERIRVAGQMIETQRLHALIEELRALVSGWKTPPTFFELCFALAIKHFVQSGCNLLILETGMGGRLDATNALAKDVAVLTPIGLDHCQYLGETLALVAAEKAGIITRKGLAVISAEQEAEVAQVIDAACLEQQTCCQYITQPCDWACGLEGTHQSHNAALALAALRALPRFCASEAVLREGLRLAYWPARMERVGSYLIDGAHNAHAMRVLTDSWRARYGAARTSCIFAVAADKDLSDMLPLLCPLVEQWVLPPVNSARMMEPTQLAQLIEQQSEAPIHLADSMAQLFELPLREEPPYLLCGSFFLIGEFLSLVERQEYRSSMQ